MDIWITIVSFFAVLLLLVLIAGVVVVTRRQRIEKSSSGNAADRRRFTRTPIRISAELAPGSGEIVEGRTSDLSVMGMFFCFKPDSPAEARKSLDKGQECRVALIIEGGNSPIRLNLRGVIMHRAEDGVGVEFVKMNREAFDNLRYVICYNADNEDRIQSEISSHFSMKLE